MGLFRKKEPEFTEDDRAKIMMDLRIAISFFDALDKAKEIKGSEETYTSNELKKKLIECIEKMRDIRSYEDRQRAIKKYKIHFTRSTFGSTDIILGDKGMEDVTVRDKAEIILFTLSKLDKKEIDKRLYFLKAHANLD